MKRLSILLILLLAASTPAWSGTPEKERTEPAAASTPETRQPAATASPAPAAPNHNLDWYSINSGGAIEVASTNYRLGASVGQAVAGQVAGTNYNLGIGFWAIFGSAEAACLVEMTGDVDTSGAITAADIIACVNYVFKGGAVPKPCEAAGDVNCDGAVTASDIIYLVNHVFKGGAVPCDVCTIIPSVWTCP
jgi:hypothetical protein